MIVTARAFKKGTEGAVSDRIKMCEKRGGVSASLFLDTELNDALPRAKCLFFFGGKRKWKGLLSVFYPTECEAEFTVAVAEQEERVIPALFRAALKECGRRGVEECFTVVNPSMGFRYVEQCGVDFTYSHSEFFLCSDTEALATAAPLQMCKEPDITLQKQEPLDEPVRYSLLVNGEEATECFLSPFDGGAGWYLYHLETKEQFRRQGLATRLISEVVRDISAQGAKVLRLQVSSNNVPAERLYRKLGFRTEEQRDFYRTETRRKSGKRDGANKQKELQG